MRKSVVCVGALLTCCQGGSLGNLSFHSTAGVNYGIEYWNGATYSAAPIVVDCLTLQCQASGRRELIHAFGPLTKTIPYPDSTMTTFSDACDIKTVVSASLASGKIAVVFYPWLSNCVYANPPRGISSRVARLRDFVDLNFVALAISSTLGVSISSSVYSCFIGDFKDPNSVPDFPVSYISPTVDTLIQYSTIPGMVMTLDDQENRGLTFLGLSWSDERVIPGIIMKSIAVCLIAYYFFLMVTGFKNSNASLSSQIGPFYVVLLCSGEACWGLYKESQGRPFSRDRATPAFIAFPMFFEDLFLVATSFAIISPWVKVIVNRRLAAWQSIALDLIFVAISAGVFGYLCDLLSSYAFKYSGDEYLGGGGSQATKNLNGVFEGIYYSCLVAVGVFGLGLLLLCMRLFQAVRTISNMKSQKTLVWLLAHTIVASIGIIAANIWLATGPVKVMWDKGSPALNTAKQNNPLGLDLVLKMYLICVYTSLATRASSSSSSSSSSS